MLSTLAGQAQEKAMTLHRSDGTSTLTRVSEVSKITFLSIADQGKGMIVSTINSEPTTVLFEDQPEVSVSGGKLLVSSKASDSPVEIEIGDVAEIRFDKATALKAPDATAGIVCVLQSGAALFRGIPEGVVPEVCTIDGKHVPVRVNANGELKLSRSLMGTGIYVVRIGSFQTKVTL